MADETSKLLSRFKKALKKYTEKAKMSTVIEAE